MFLGMAIPACGGDDEDSTSTIGDTAQPAYGVPATETQDPTTDPSVTMATTTPGESSTGGEEEGSSSSSTGTETDGDTGSTSIEPDYGVPTTE